MEKQLPDTGVPMFERPNLLFGNDVYFSPTPRLDELRRKVAEQNSIYVKDMAEKEWDESQYGPREAWEARIDIATENNAQNDYYAMRFRSRDLPDTIHDDYRGFVSRYDHEGAEVATEAVANEFALLDKFMGEQAWATTFYAARRLHQLLSEGLAEKENAKTYAAFSGGIIAQEFCRMALAYADERLAGEYMPRLKHLATICWPVLDALKEFAPEEAATKMQLLREILLEQLAQVGDEYSIDSNITLMARDFSMTDRETLRKFYVMDTDEATKQRIRERMELHIQRLVAEHRYDAAINVLYKTAFSTTMDPGPAQARLNQLAEVGYEELSLHFSHIGDYDYDNMQHSRALLIDNRHISPATSQKLKTIHNSRNLEVILGKFDGSEDPQTANDLLKALGMADPIEARRMSRETAYKLSMIVKKYKGSNIGMDRLLEAYLGASKIPDLEMYVTDIIATQMDSVIENAQTKSDEYLMPFLAVVSPVIRYTKPGETPEDDEFWKLVSKKQVAEYFSVLRSLHGPNLEFRYKEAADGGHEPALLDEDEAFMMSDLRAWFTNVWRYLEYYD